MSTSPAHHLILRVDVVSPVEHAVDLVVVGLVLAADHAPLVGSLHALDTRLGGALEQMRAARAIAGSSRSFGRAADVAANAILLVGLGAEYPKQGVVAALEAMGRLAVEHAVKLGAATVGIAPGLRDAGVQSLDVADVARAIAKGARAAYAARVGVLETPLVVALEASTGNADIARAALGS